MILLVTGALVLGNILAWIQWYWGGVCDPLGFNGTGFDKNILNTHGGKTYMH